MTPASAGSLLERFRPYLHVLARTQVDRRLHDRIDLSGVVQQTLLEALQALAMIPAERSNPICQPSVRAS
jgi:hypothetical protein